MSTAWYGYLIDLSALSNVYGSHDNLLLSAIENNFAPEIEFNARDYRSAIGNGMPSVIQVLHDIIVGKITYPEFPWQYGNALLLICKQIGTELPNDQFQMMQLGLSSMFDDPDMQDVTKFMLGTPKYPIPIPAIEDYPLVTYITRQEAAIELSKHPVALRSDESENHMEIKRPTIDQFRSWLKSAVLYGKDIVTFYY